jgi:Flp pilus assembly protein TadG
MVEFALVGPLLIVIVFAVIQFGVLYNNYVTVTDAARAGARKAAVSRLAPSPEADAEAAVRSSATNLDQAKLVVDVTTPAWEHGNDVTVEARYPYQVNLLGWVVASGQLKSSTTERVE